MMKRSASYALGLVLAPLFAGMLLYLLLRPETYLSRVIYAALSISPPTTPSACAAVCFLKSYACDMLWAFALMAMVVWIVGKLPLSVGICGIFETAVECCQLCPCFGGTFDVWDIVLELLATLFCGLAIKIWTRNKGENT